MWQDLVLGGTSLVLCVAMIPTILGRDKPNRWTAAMFVATLLTSASVMVNLELWLTAVTQYVGAVEWGITIFQRRRP